MSDQPYVHVIRRIGESFFTRCTATVENDVLTIAPIDPNGLVTTIEPGFWRACRVFDANHVEVDGYICRTPCLPLLTLADLRASAETLVTP